MRRRGFVLYEIIIGLFFVGILSVVFLPILSTSFNNYSRIKDRNEMSYIGEMVVEKLKTSTSNIEDVLTELESNGEVNYTDDDFDSEKYSCKIVKTYSSDHFLEFIVKVTLSNQENSHYVEYKASIPKS